MLPVRWTHSAGQHCVSDEDARNLLINIESKDTHIEILEGYIDAMRGTKGVAR